MPKILSAPSSTLSWLVQEARSVPYPSQLAKSIFHRAVNHVTRNYVPKLTITVNGRQYQFSKRISSLINDAYAYIYSLCFSAIVIFIYFDYYYAKVERLLGISNPRNLNPNVDLIPYVNVFRVRNRG